MECAHCHRTITGRRRAYCDTRCKKRAWRRRRAGLCEDALAGSGRRGRVALAASTRDELNAALEAALNELRAITDDGEAALAAEQLLNSSPAPAAARMRDKVAAVRAEITEGRR